MHLLTRQSAGIHLFPSGFPVGQRGIDGRFHARFFFEGGFVMKSRKTSQRFRWQFGLMLAVLSLSTFAFAPDAMGQRKSSSFQLEVPQRANRPRPRPAVPSRWEAKAPRRRVSSRGDCLDISPALSMTSKGKRSMRSKLRIGRRSRAIEKELEELKEKENGFDREGAFDDSTTEAE